MNREYDEQTTSCQEPEGDEQKYAYKNVIRDKQHRRTWSVISLALSILSVLLTYFSWVGLVLALASVVCAIVSRKNLGYFDKLSLGSIIVSIFGIMFAVTGLVFGDIIFGFLS